MTGKLKADKANNYAYNKILQPFANKLRKEMTKAEACLWKYALRASQMKGYQFRRQRPVLRYIADFLCKELKLVIEVDGITHQDEETWVKDKRKTSDLEGAGFKVIRFTDEEVLKNMNGVIERIERVVEETEMSSPPPAPPPAGDSYHCLPTSREQRRL
ncbi:MAG TPA: endonuclease domain-containing protein [Candidatus Wunengus sp. YC61]|uniref:endonuclease domain-containing protein n=1 Tax=Candidatus Wunengus sp. YC61 TaxID=3367698 RepID=UPI0040282308